MSFASIDCRRVETNPENVCYTFWRNSGVVQLVARQPLELVILVRVQAPEPILGDTLMATHTPAGPQIQEDQIPNTCRTGAKTLVYRAVWTHSSSSSA
jgi:hypothetical protein